MEESAGSIKVKPFAWEKRLQRLVLIIARLGLGYLFFSSLFWKLPPRFGCDPGFAFSRQGPDGQLVRSTGLCDWLGIESTYATPDRRFLVTADEYGSPIFSIGLGPLVRANGFFVQEIVQPNINWFGWVVFLAEAFIALSLFLGLLSRGGALVSVLLSIHLMLGLAGVWNPAAHLQEWEWSYHLMILLSLVLLAVPPGRVLGLDALIRPRLAAGAQSGRRLATALLALT
jgi:uncharacterized membrane protein YphA (DoxX/SURF4 family)